MKKIFYSTVSAELLSKAAIQLSLFGLLAFLPLLLSTIFLPKESLQWAGPLFFIFWLALLFPLTRKWTHLRKLDQHPTKIEINCEILLFQGHPVCSLDEIDFTDYFEEKNRAGLTIHTKKGEKFFFSNYSEQTCKAIRSQLEEYRGA